MAAPMLLMATDQTNAAQETKPEPTKTRGRKSSKGPNQKKQPQRGLGVAQLERLRLQERWKKMTEVTQPHLNATLPPHHFHCQTPLLVEPPLGNVPGQYAAPNYGGAPAVANDYAGGVLAFDHAGLVVQRMGNGGFLGAGAGGSSGVGGLIAVDPYPHGIGMDPRLLIGSSVETSRELSSMPKMLPCVSDRCDICFKKKRVNVGNAMLSNGEREKNIAEMPPINSSDFLGLSIENYPNSAGEFSSSAVRGVSHADYTGCNLDKGAEVKQIHRKLGNTVQGGSFLMEYEFFPGKGGRGTCFKELEFPTEASLAEVDGEASCITTSTATYGATNNPNALDLSLKLSF